jgi:single-strand DNA-binding protein
MGSLNRVQIIGYLGKDPEIRRTQSGKPVANLSIATSESWTSKQNGEKMEKTEWHRVVIFSEGLCGVAEKYLHKGSQVFIEGKLQTRKWTDKDKVERYSTEIVMDGFNSNLVMLGKAGDGGGRGEGDQRRGSNNEDAEASQDAGYADKGSGAGGGARRQPGNQDDMDDEIPFAYPLDIIGGLGI